MLYRKLLSGVTTTSVYPSARPSDWCLGMPSGESHCSMQRPTARSMCLTQESELWIELMAVLMPTMLYPPIMSFRYWKVRAAPPQTGTSILK